MMTHSAVLDMVPFVTNKCMYGFCDEVKTLIIYVQVNSASASSKDIELY